MTSTMINNQAGRALTDYSFFRVSDGLADNPRLYKMI